MAGLRGILAAFAISSAIIALPAAAQSRGSASLTHTVTVTVPPRVKVQVANLAFATPTPVRVSSRSANVDGLSLTINSNRAWVLTIGSQPGAPTRKARLQWSPDGSSAFTTVTTSHLAVASGDTSFDARAATLFFRNVNSATGSSLTASGEGEPVVLTVSAP